MLRSSMQLGRILAGEVQQNELIVADLYDLPLTDEFDLVPRRLRCARTDASDTVVVKKDELQRTIWGPSQAGH